MNNVSVIIPAYNEEKTIGQVIDKVRESTIQTEIIVVNNCSTDRTEELAKQKGAKTIYCGNRGKGYAMEEGLKHATGNIVMFIDGDLGIYINDIISLMVNPIIEKKADFTKSAFSREGGRVTELVAKPLLELLFPNIKSFEQPLSGIIAGTKEAFDNITFEKDYNSQSWQSLPKMAKEVASAILKRANKI